MLRRNTIKQSVELLAYDGQPLQTLCVWGGKIIAEHLTKLQKIFEQC